MEDILALLSDAEEKISSVEQILDLAAIDSVTQFLDRSASVGARLGKAKSLLYDKKRALLDRLVKAASYTTNEFYAFNTTVGGYRAYLCTTSLRLQKDGKDTNEWIMCSYEHKELYTQFCFKLMRSIVSWLQETTADTKVREEMDLLNTLIEDFRALELA